MSKFRLDRRTAIVMLCYGTADLAAEWARPGTNWFALLAGIALVMGGSKAFTPPTYRQPLAAMAEQIDRKVHADDADGAK